MSLQLSPKSQRLRARKAEVTHQLIVFRLRQEWFALPIHVAQKVIPLGKLYGAGNGTDVSLALYQDREIPVLDIQRRIFGTGSQPLLPGKAASSHPTNHAELSPATPLLLLVQTSAETTIGFPLDTQPSLRRVPESAFVPLSPTYLAGGQVRCAKCLIVLDSEQPPIFLLNLDQLLQLQPTLPPQENIALPG
ncbi:MAG: chemotaxis protein CheW [Stenomitos rutilans HA7619-LM2]|jgi:purine-binding chemotaxis protein CheW|nr:chemotaxis protein CheW [Stenomitos rutilans HA7619-LM2]